MLLEPLADDRLHDILSASFGVDRRAVECVSRQVFKHRVDWRGSRLFEKLTVRVGSTPARTLLLKYNQPAVAQPSLHAPALEAGAYRHLLSSVDAGTPKFFAYRPADGSGPALLLLEYVEGKRLKKFADEQTWIEVATWLARMHAHFSQPDVLARFPLLVRHDRAYFWDRVTAATEGAARVSRRAGMLLGLVLQHYDRVVEPLTSEPATLIHGEFFCTNILIGGNGDGVRVCPFDWETAAAGCAFMDLTCLVQQRRSKIVVDRSRIVEAYLEARSRYGGTDVSFAEAEAQMRRCRIHGFIHDILTGVSRRDLAPEKIEKYAQLANEQLEILESVGV